MHLQNVFRSFLLGDVVLTTATVVAGFRVSDVATATEDLEVMGRFVVLAIWLAALVGLWLLRRWARVLYIGVASAGLLAAWMLDGGGATGLRYAVGSLCWLLTGAIIALAYWSPLASAFRANRKVTSHPAPPAA